MINPILPCRLSWWAGGVTGYRSISLGTERLSLPSPHLGSIENRKYGLISYVTIIATVFKDSRSPKRHI